MKWKECLCRPSQVGLQSMLRLIILACLLLENSVLQFVHSDLNLAGYNIEIGDLASKAAEVNAIAKLSNGPDQQSWWKLAGQLWHDSAIHRYFYDGPLQAVEMARLAEMDGKKNAWNAANISQLSSAERTDLKGMLQGLSTAMYRMSKWIEGTGKINASMWTLLFRCRFTEACDQGYLLPIITIPRDDQRGNTQQPASYMFANLSYATLWVNLTTNVAVHATPSLIRKLPAVKPHRVQDVEDVDPELTIFANIHHHNFPECSDSSAAFSYRSLLDASYGLVPGIECIRFNISTDEQLSFLVSRTLYYPSNGTSAAESRGSTITLEKLVSELLQVDKRDQWEIRPFEDCSTAMLLMTYQDVSSSPIILCDQQSKICIRNYAGQDGGSLEGSCSGVQHLRVLQHLVTNQSKACTFYINDEPVIELNATSTPQYAIGSCPLGSTGKICNASIYYEAFEAIRLVCSQSDWISSDGNVTSEFRQAPHVTDMDAVSHICIRKISSQLLTNSTQAAFHEAIQIRARSYLNSFITEHHRAFTTVQGPATDVANFVALSVSTAISVMLAIFGPFTNICLKQICRIKPDHLDSQCSSRMHKAVTVVLFQTVCSVLLSVFPFLPVLYLARSEKKREDPFYTWDLASADQNIYNSFGDNVHMRIIYLLSATSTYSSHLIIASTVVICITCVVVAICSILRCKDILDRYTILKKHDSLLEANGSTDTRTNYNQEDKGTTYARALRALNMTEAEYVTMKAEVDRSANLPAQELSARRHALLRPQHISTVELQQQATAVHPTHSCEAARLANAHTGTVDIPDFDSPQSLLLMDNVRSV